MILTIIGLVGFSIFTRLQVMALRRRLNLLTSALANARDSTGQLLLNSDVGALVWGDRMAR